MQELHQRKRRNDDGLRITEKPGGQVSRRRWTAAAMGVALCGGVAMTFLSGEPETQPAPRAEMTPPAAQSQGERASTTSRRDAAPRAHSVRTTQPEATAPAPVAEPLPASIEEAARAVAESTPEKREEATKSFEARAQEMLAEARAAGNTKGIAVFPPPGTNPIKHGLVVPKNFDLPEGYVRHHQVTDDGRRLEPILMFSPDYDFVDGQGNPLEIPADGIVPQHMAPGGMPIRMLAIPKDPYGATASAQ